MKSFYKDKLIKDYYKCTQVEYLKKKDSSPYIKLCLLNNKGLFDGYLWNMVEFFADKVNEDEVYAIKAKEEIYNNAKVLNIQNIKPIVNGNYDKYGYTLDKLSISRKQISKFHYNSLLESVSLYRNKTIDLILEFYTKNKNEIITSDLLNHKYNCFKHMLVLSENYGTKIDKKLCIILILIDRLSTGSLIEKIKLVNIKYYNLIKFYQANDKEFIKKYKYIVDLISYNFNNESFFKTK